MTWPTPSAMIATALAWTVLVLVAHAQPGPPTPRRIAEISLRRMPTTVTYRGRPVRLRYPDDPEVRALGGSGGPMIHIDITPPDGAPVFVFETQGIGLALVESASDWPAFEVWSKLGVGNYTRAVYTWRARERQYCSDRVDDFEVPFDEAAGSVSVPFIGEQHLLRFTRSRGYGCGQ